MLTASVSQMVISSATKLCWAPVFFLPVFFFLLPVPDLDAILFPPYCFLPVNPADANSLAHVSSRKSRAALSGGRLYKHTQY